MPTADEVEIKFAQRLAGNTKTIRDRAVRKLKKYLNLKSQKPGGGFTRDEMLKIWKGLFYCMWMSDKMLVQEELSQTISEFVHCFENDKAAMLFFETFLATMNREWGGIDRLRMDKFYMLVRNVIQQSMLYIKRKKWDKGLMNWWIAILNNNAIKGTTSPNGLAYHVSDLYFEELSKIGKGSLKAQQIQTFLDPYCDVLTKTRERAFFDFIQEHIFQEMIEESQIARQLLQEESSNFNAEELFSNDEKPLAIDYKLLVNKLKVCTKEKNILSYNRKKIYSLIKSFNEMAEGRLPLDEYPDLSEDSENDDEFNLEQSKLVNRLLKEGDKERVHRKNKRKMRRKKQKEEEAKTNGSPEESEEDSNSVNEEDDERTTAEINGIEDDLEPEDNVDADSAAIDNYVIYKHELKKQKKKQTARKRKILSAKLDSDSDNNISDDDSKSHSGKILNGVGEQNEHSNHIKRKKKKCKVALNHHDDEKEQNVENSFATFENGVPKPVASFFRVAASKANEKKTKKQRSKEQVTETLSTPQNTKRVSFQMSKIQIQPFRKNEKSMCVSPSPNNVAFDPSRKPDFGLLKTKLQPKHKRF